MKNFKVGELVKHMYNSSQVGIVLDKTRANQRDLYRIQWFNSHIAKSWVDGMCIYDDETLERLN